MEKITQPLRNESFSKKSYTELIESFFSFYSLIRFGDVFLCPLKGDIFNREILIEKFQSFSNDLNYSITKEPLLLIEPFRITKNIGVGVQKETLNKFNCFCKEMLVDFLCYQSREKNFLKT